MLNCIDEIVKGVRSRTEWVRSNGLNSIRLRHLDLTVGDKIFQTPLLT